MVLKNSFFCMLNVNVWNKQSGWMEKKARPTRIEFLALMVICITQSFSMMCDS